jgi:hypothetical protein
LNADILQFGLVKPCNHFTIHNVLNITLPNKLQPTIFLRQYERHGDSGNDKRKMGYIGLPKPSAQYIPSPVPKTCDHSKSVASSELASVTWRETLIHFRIENLVSSLPSSVTNRSSANLRM